MISRKKILSKSCDKIIEDNKSYGDQEVWYNKDKLFKDHIREILDKWDQIDDDIWAKVIFMERNRRVAKAYVRAQVITFNGSNRGFDGHVVGLQGFVNSKRDEKTSQVLENFGDGMKMKIDDSGDILIKKLSRSNIRVTGSSKEYSCLGSDLIESGGRLEIDKPMTMFQMKKLINTIGSELRSTYPDQRRLEAQCITCVAVDIESDNLLETPCWMMIINIVAMEVIKYRVPCMMMRQEKIPDFVAIFDQKSEDGQRGQQNQSSQLIAIESRANKKKSLEDLKERKESDKENINKPVNNNQNHFNGNNNSNNNTSHQPSSLPINIKSSPIYQQNQNKVSTSSRPEVKESVTGNGQRYPIKVDQKRQADNNPKDYAKREVIIEIPKPDYEMTETNGKLKRREETFERNSSEKISEQLFFAGLPKIDESIFYQLHSAIINSHSKTTGYLNSAMRKLPVNSRLSSCSSSSDSSQSSGSEPSYYHIYSSIGEGIKLTNCLPANNLYPCDKIIKYYVGNWE